MGIEKMKNRFIRHVLILLLCGFCHTAAFAYGYDRNDQSKAWGYQPLYSTAASAQKTKVVGSGFGHASTTTYQGIYSTARAAVVATSAPAYTFRTTSLYITSSDASESMYSAPTGSGPLRTSSFDWNDDDNPLGEVDDPMPVGDTPWLFMLILIATFYSIKGASRLRDKQAFTQKNRPI